MNISNVNKACHTVVARCLTDFILKLLLKLHEQHVCSCSCGSIACGDAVVKAAHLSSQLSNICYGRTIDSLRQVGRSALITWRQVQVIGNLSCWGSQSRTDATEEIQDEWCGGLLSLSQLLEKPPLNPRLCSRNLNFLRAKIARQRQESWSISYWFSTPYFRSLH